MSESKKEKPEAEKEQPNLEAEKEGMGKFAYPAMLSLL